MADVSALTRVARIVDLFSEGETVLLGFDTNTRPIEPIVVWVNKLNTFETAEARADGVARRSERMYALAAENSPERLGFDAEIHGMSDDEMAENYVEAHTDEIYLDVINDIETDPEWRERRDRLERLPSLLEDAGAAADDPRRKQLTQDQREWLEAINTGTAKAREVKRKAGLEMGRQRLADALWERYRQRQTMEVFMAERRTTQLYFALRECNATNLATEPGKYEWDHTDCDHNKRLLHERAAVRTLPDGVIEKVEAALDDMTINPRAAGNLDAPASSYASSEPASAAAVDSTPSIPVETSPEPPTS